jgi:arsenate reductase (thioredoxin)
MGCGDACPVLPGKRYIDWDLPDPAGRRPEEVRAIRDEILRLVNELAATGEKVVTGQQEPRP